MPDEPVNGPPPSAALRPPTIAAAVDLYALVRSLPSSGKLSDEDLQVLNEWETRYEAAHLPFRGQISSVVIKTLSEGVMSQGNRAWLYLVIDAALPRQLRKAIQRQRLLGEIREARLGGRACVSVAFDFLLAGSHLTKYREQIEGRLQVGNAVRMVAYQHDDVDMPEIRVELPSGDHIIGFVPVEDTPAIAQSIDENGSLDGVVKKILSDGLFAIPVIGTRVRYAETAREAPVPIAPWKEPVPAEPTAAPSVPAKSPLSVIARALGVFKRHP
jgi:hypothetical protein